MDININVKGAVRIELTSDILKEVLATLKKGELYPNTQVNSVSVEKNVKKQAKINKFESKPIEFKTEEIKPTEPKPAKLETTPTEEVTPTPSVEKEPEKVEEPEPEPEGIPTREELTKLMKHKIANGKALEIKAVIKDCGCTSIRDLPDNMITDLYKIVKEI